MKMNAKAFNRGVTHILSLHYHRIMIAHAKRVLKTSLHRMFPR